MMFLDCPAYPDQEGARPCGLPAEVRYRFTMRSTGGPLESAAIRCPAGHWFNGPIEFLTWDRTNTRDPGTAVAASRAGTGSPPSAHDGRDSRAGFPDRDIPAGPERDIRRPNGAPAYYLGRPARMWITALHPRRSRTPSNQLTEAGTAADNEHYPDTAARQPAPGAADRVPQTLA